MDFWDNILRYPRFFLSSMLGLFLVVVTPLIKLFKELPNKKVFFFLFFSIFGIFAWTLNLMINPDY